MERKKALIITYYWPPGGGAGVQRWLKMAKYLPEFGWDPIIYTPENPEVPAIDKSLLIDVTSNIKVIKNPIWEPYTWYKKFIGQDKNKPINAGFLSEKQKPKFREKVSVWLRGNFFIPDARKFWINPSVRFLSKYLQENHVDVIISTGPPHSMHLIALKIRQRLNIPWLADFRDPWTNIDFYKDLRLSPWADRKHHKLEHLVLTNAQQVLTIGWTLADELTKLGARNVQVITNGFDPDDFNSELVEKDDKFVITHIGAMNRDRNPILFWEVLSDLIQANDTFSNKVSIRLIGKNDISVTNSISEMGLTSKVQCIEHLDHKEVIQYLYKSHVLLLAINNAPNMNVIIPGKLFEYLASGRPIIGIGPKNGDAAKILNRTGSGVMIDYKDKAILKESLNSSFSDYIENREQINKTSEEFSRKNLTRELSKILLKMASGH